jgi:uncharacterized protein (DUF488 family)
MVIFTIGHSTHPLPEFIGLLKLHGVSLVVDVRTVPRSRHNPQYNRETLPGSLALENIAYEHMAGLGGLRKADSPSPNTAWRNASFRGFADYMQTEAFRDSIDRLAASAELSRPALMCAEALPWRCHRWLIADALKARGIEVDHIMAGGNLKGHVMTGFAKVVDRGRVIYPAEPGAFCA